MINWEVIIWTCITLAVIMGVIGLILYAISAKNMRNKRKELGEVHTDMKVGSRIMFAGGIYGKIVSTARPMPSALRTEVEVAMVGQVPSTRTRTGFSLMIPLVKVFSLLLIWFLTLLSQSQRRQRPA